MCLLAIQYLDPGLSPKCMAMILFLQIQHTPSPSAIFLYCWLADIVLTFSIGFALARRPLSSSSLGGFFLCCHFF